MAFSLTFIIFSGVNLFSQKADTFPVTSESYRIYPGDVTQTEVFIVKSPLDQNVLFSACNTLTFIPFFVSEGIYSTSDGGNTWQGSDTCKGEPISFHGGDPGIAIDKNGTFILTRLGRPPLVGLYSHYSFDNGRTWSAQNVISTDDLERASVATDVNPASLFYGRSYAAWVKFAQPFPLMVSFTDDGAKNWSNPLQINNPQQRCAGGDVAIGPDGELYVCWAGVTDVSPFREIYVGFAASQNGGTEWQVYEDAFEMNGITGLLTNKDNIRVNGLPGIAVDTTDGPYKGWIYVITGQKNLSPAGSDPDIILNRSTDGGKTWSQAIRVNRDELNNGKTQYFPTVHVDQFGAVNIIFFDDRFTTNDSTGVMLARSLDGGDSWAEYLISDHNYKPTPIGGLAGQGYQGDNIDLTSTDSDLWPVWMDNSSGNYQIWTAPVSFESLDGFDEPVGFSSGLSLGQNYPNPFKNNTVISYKLTKTGFVSLKIFDSFGREVMSPVNEKKSPGTYEIEINADELRGNSIEGIFFYKLQQLDQIDVKSMLRVR